MNRAIITGPTGSIGMALIEVLSNNGIQVIAVVRPDSSREKRIVENANVIKVFCDLSELDKLAELVSEAVKKKGWEENADTVFYHFGWDGTFGNSRNNMYGQNTNVKFSLDAVKAAKECGCSAFVGAGSQAEYGRFEGKLNALTPAFPENGYGMAKLCAGQMTRVYANELGLRHIWTRILSIYGPYDGAKTMVMSTIDKLLRGEPADTTKGEQMWDYLYSKDAGKAFYLIGMSGVDGKTYCVGGGNARPLHDYICDMKTVAKSESELRFGAIPYSDKQVMYLCADIEELTKDTGFTPEYDFNIGIAQTIDWVKNNSSN